MKTSKANNLQQALKELEAIDGLKKETIEKFNGEVREADRKKYHVILVKKIHDAAKQRYLVSIVRQQYGKRSWEKVKNSVVQLGFHKAILLHDPSQLKEEDAPTLTTKEQLEIDADVKKQLEEKHAKEVAELKAQLAEAKKNEKANEKNANGSDGSDNNKNATGDGSGDKGGDIVGSIDIKEAKKAEIEKFAEDNGIDFGDKHLVDDIREIVAKWLDAKATDKK